MVRHRSCGRTLRTSGSTETLRVPDGLRVDLVAAEPLVAGAVAMDIDEYGRIWVAQMPGFP